jgi:tetratricopeptide (TPR) repeat protein
MQLSSLVHKSLLQLQTSERYEIHEFVRQFAEERLRISGVEADARERHLRYFVSVARTGNDALLTAAQIPWLLRLKKEHDNLRAALLWSTHSTRIPDAGIQLIGNMGWFWYFAGHWQEGFTWVEKVLPEKKHFEATKEYARALYVAGGLAISVDKYEQGSQYLNWSIELSRQVSDSESLGFALSLSSLTHLYTGRYPEGKSAALESIVNFEALNHPTGYYWSLGVLGEVLLFGGEYIEAQQVFEKCVKYYQGGVNTLLPYALVHLGKTERYLGHYELAHKYLSEALRIARDLQAQRFMAQALHGLTRIALHHKEVVRAARLIRDAIILFQKLGDGMGLAECFDTAATVFRLAGQHETAIKVFGAADAFREEIGVPVPAGDFQAYSEEIQLLQRLLGKEAFGVLWSEWRSFSDETLVTVCVNQLLAIRDPGI